MAILEGFHGFQYSDYQRDSIFTDVCNSVSKGNGQLILLEGPSGSGVTMFLNNVASHPQFRGVTLHADFFKTAHSLIDRVCDAYCFEISARPHTNLPEALKKYFKLTGERMLVADDLEAFCANDSELESLAQQVAKLTENSSGMSLVCSTRSYKLRKILDTYVPRLISVWLDGKLTRFQADDLINKFWSYLNQKYGFRHRGVERVYKISSTYVLEIHLLIKNVELTYLATMLGLLAFIDGEKSNLEVLTYEIQKKIYS